MKLRITCPACRKVLETGGTSMGGRVGCPGCGSPVTVPRTDFAPGTRISGFELLRPLGKGGMGEVYLARQLSMGREIALKILSAELAANPGARERFLKEVHLAAKLEHPHIVAAYDAGEDEGLCYMAMSFVPGSSLAARLKPGAVLAEHDALKMTRKLAQALDYAWNRFHIIHRDIKPANILFDADGEPKLADMGLSKSLDDAEAMTMSGAVMGTPNYMSPEQAEGAGDLDQRADIYSLGATLYHAVTGQMPFAGSSIMAVLRKQAIEILPDPRQFNSGVSEHCVGLLQVMLAKNRDDRYADWKALIQDIDCVLDSKPPSVALPGEGRSVLIRKASGHGPQRKIVVPKEGRPASPPPAPPPPGKKPMKPRDKALALGGALVLGLVALAAVLAVQYSRQRIETRKVEAQREALKAAEVRDREAQAAKLREQAELWQVAADFAAANPGEFDRAVANFEDAGKRLAGTKFELMAKNEIERVRAARTAAVDRAFAELETRAKELADRKDFDGAAEVFAKYQGALAADLAAQRTSQERRYRALAAEAADKLTQAERMAREAERAAIAAGADAIYAGDLAKALEACKAFLDDAAVTIDKSAVKRIAGWIEAAAGADKALLATFDAQKGKEIVLTSGTTKVSLRVTGVRGDRVLFEQKKGVGWASGELALAQIPLEERQARLAGKLDPAAVGIWNGAAFLRARRPDLASEAFKPTGELASLLLAKTEGAKSGEREAAAQAAFVQVLQSASLPAVVQPDAIAERVAPGKVTVAQAAAALRQLDAYAAAFGDTQHAKVNAAVAAALRPALEAAQKGVITPPPGMVLIPAGSFQMGDALGDDDKSEHPVRTVTVGAFYMDKCEVTKALWDEVYTWARSHGYDFENAGSGKAMNHPVHTVNWYDVVKWCNARSEKEGQQPCYVLNGSPFRTGQGDPKCTWSSPGYRLPTEAEWEKAARGGAVGRRFPWADSDTISHSRANYLSGTNFAYDLSPTRGFHPTYAVGEQPFTSPVGSFPPNGYGLFDMTGNVFEWCWDWKGICTSRAATDPHGADTGQDRLLRGGGWLFSLRICRVAVSDPQPPAFVRFTLGFRTVMTLADAAARPPSPAVPSTPPAAMAPKPGEWKTLFDGKSLDGWEAIGKPWKVSNHALTASEKSVLRTAAKYDDFELEMEWRMDRGANGGVFYLVGDGDNNRGPELQLCDPKSAGTTQTGGLYGVLDPSRDESKAVGNWNTARLLVRGNHREHWINSVKVLAYDIDDAAYLRALDASKIKGPSGFKSAQKGFIVLQSNQPGSEVAYRNIRIREPGR